MDPVSVALPKNLRKFCVATLVQVDEHGNLKLLLLGPATGLTSYDHSVAQQKNFDAVLFKANVDTTQNDVLGYDLTIYEGVGGEIGGDKTFVNLILHDVSSIAKLDLDNGGVMKKA